MSAAVTRTPPDGFPYAFMAAFDEMQQVNDLHTNDVEYQAAVNAIEGAKQRARHGQDNTAFHSAIACLVAFEDACRMLEPNAIGDLNDDQTAATILIRDTLRNLWRDFHDRGGQQAWNYAEYVGAVQKHDRFARGR